ncbi:hypothetical protein LXL04_037707 [Taraxacum kok-saghyz]
MIDSLGTQAVNDYNQRHPDEESCITTDQRGKQRWMGDSWKEASNKTQIDNWENFKRPADEQEYSTPTIPNYTPLKTNLMYALIKKVNREKNKR